MLNIQCNLKIIIIKINLPGSQMHLVPDNSKCKETSHFVQAFGSFSAEQLSLST